jgi:acyl carrier protein
MARARGTFRPSTTGITMDHSTDRLLRKILTEVLGLKPGQAQTFRADTGLFGHLPELDSMAVAGLLTEMEDRLDDDEIDGELLETYGSLLAFAQAKRGPEHDGKDA